MYDLDKNVEDEPMDEDLKKLRELKKKYKVENFCSTNERLLKCSFSGLFTKWWSIFF